VDIQRRTYKYIPLYFVPLARSTYKSTCRSVQAFLSYRACCQAIFSLANARCFLYHGTTKLAKLCSLSHARYTVVDTAALPIVTRLCYCSKQCASTAWRGSRMSPGHHPWEMCSARNYVMRLCICESAQRQNLDTHSAADLRTVRTTMFHEEVLQPLTMP